MILPKDNSCRSVVRASATTLGGHRIDSGKENYITELGGVTFLWCSAYKNKGVQLLLDGVSDYLPCPMDVKNVALVTLFSCQAYLIYLRCALKFAKSPSHMGDARSLCKLGRVFTGKARRRV